MINRRQFVIGAGSVLATPFILRRSALAQTPRVRRDVMAMAPDDPFFSDYADAVRAMHGLGSGDGRNWRNQALIHLNHCPHGGPTTAMDFVHWHRNYILFYEQICGTLIGKSDFALPYWNWQSGIGQIPDPFYDRNELNVVYWNDPSDAQSDNWGPDEVTTTGVRALAKGSGLKQDPQRGGAFTDQNIESIQRLTDYSLYTGRLEGSPHNSAHVIAGGFQGHMGDGMSPLDPIFWLHHCNVDRLAAEWQAAGNTMPPLDDNFDGQFVDGEGRPVPANSASVVNIGNLGYAYETPSGLITGPAPGPVAMSLFAAPAPQAAMLGTTDQGQQAAANSTTNVSVDTSNLSEALFSARSFRLFSRQGEAKLGAESGRVLARITGVDVSNAARSLIVNVFVNLPEANPQTPFTDPHYAGTFSFFGMAGKMHHPGSYLVDITDALTQLAELGRLSSSELTLQIVPLPTGEGAPDVGFSFGGVEIFRT
ncbi:tyrosinase family protein [Arenibaculum sp.]|uniref:tyrosinase family protein n=1 Tax=Arenibaculum sp. TaxID=2865862 RepID=UPI002E0F8E9E|nr:tyrosinase family protein [Arenibaculum sp.]